MKSGQLSYFLILGLMILGLLIFTITILKPRIEVVDFSNPKSMHVFVERCLEDTARYALFQLGLQGGYITLPEEHANIAHGDIAYAFKEGNRLVSISQMEDQLSTFVGENAGKCIDQGIHFFEERFGKISYTIQSVQVHIQEEDVRFAVELPLTINAESITRLNPTYQVTVPVRLRKIHQIIAGIVQEFVSTGHLLKLECVLDRHLSISGRSFGPENLFMIEDSASTLRNSPDRINEKHRFFFVIRDR